MSSPIRLLHVVWDFSEGGLERLVTELAKGLGPAGFETHVLSLGGLGHFAEQLEGRAELHRSGPQPPWTMLAPRRLAEQIRRIGPDILHSHSGVWYKATKAGRWAGVPRIVHTDHGRVPGLTRTDLFFERRAARRTDAVLTVSPWLMDFCHHRLGVPKSKLFAATNGIDTTSFRARPSNARRPDVLPRDGLLIGSVGRLDHVKGYDVLLEAFRLLTIQLPDTPLRVVIVGDGPERENLERRAHALGVKEQLTITGWVSDVEALVPWFDIFTLSSRSEGTCLGLLEAMSCEVCPIVTNVGGNAVVLGDVLRHRLVEAEDPSALAGGWASAIRDSTARKRDGQSARTRVEAVYSLPKMLEQHETLYRRLVEGRALDLQS